MTRRIAIYGGTFDPIHHGHLGSIAALREWFSERGCSISELRLIPSHIPPHRESPGADSEQRLEMLALAAKGLENTQVDDREIRRNGTSYTIDSLVEFRREFGPDVQLLFVLGSDAFALLDTWHRWQELTNYAHMVIMRRANDGLEPSAEVKAWYEERLVASPVEMEGPAGAILSLELTPYNESATEVRNRIRDCEDIHGLVPENVANYIKRHKLYVANEGN